MATTTSTACWQSSACQAVIDALPARAALTAAALLALLLTSCGRAPAIPDDLHAFFDGERAHKIVADLVALGPRPPGSPALDASRDLMRRHFEEAGWQVTLQEFEADTPFGTTRFANVLAQRPGATPDIILASHIDTKIYREFEFVGANDGASSTATMLEIARVLNERAPDLARRILFAFFDGEECFVEYSGTDGLWGSRHFVAQLRKTNRLRQFNHGILHDMVGDSDLLVTFPSDSPPELARLFFQSSEALGYRSHFGLYRGQILDDHVPLNQAGIPTINVIDIQFPHWHTPHDTLDKVSPTSLRIVGATTLDVLRRIHHGALERGP